MALVINPRFRLDNIIYPIWERTAPRIKSELPFLTKNQAEIAANEAIQTIAFQRHFPWVQAVQARPDYMLYQRLKYRSGAGLFPPNHDYVMHENIDWAPPHIRDDYKKMITIAGEEVWQWEQHNEPFSTLEEMPGFLGRG